MLGPAPPGPVCRGLWGGPRAWEVTGWKGVSRGCSAQGTSVNTSPARLQAVSHGLRQCCWKSLNRVEFYDALGA